MEAQNIFNSKSELDKYIKLRVRKELQEIQYIDEIEQQEIDELYSKIDRNKDIEFIEL